MTLDFECIPLGDPGGEPVLFLHCFNSDGTCDWLGTAVCHDLLTRLYCAKHPEDERRVCYMLRPTLRPEDFSNVEKMLDRLARLIRAVTKPDRQSAHIVGLSMGAHIALRLAARHPGVVDSLFLSGYMVLPRMMRFCATWFLYVRGNFWRHGRFTYLETRNLMNCFGATDLKLFHKPTLIAFGSREDPIARRSSIELQRVMEDNGGVAEVLEGEDLDHTWPRSHPHVLATYLASLGRNEWPRVMEGEDTKELTEEEKEEREWCKMFKKVGR